MNCLLLGQMHSIFHCFCSVAKSCLILYDPKDVSKADSSAFAIAQSLLKFMFIESVMLSKHLIFYNPLFLLPSIFPDFEPFKFKLALCLVLLLFDSHTGFQETGEVVWYSHLFKNFLICCDPHSQRL